MRKPKTKRLYNEDGSVTENGHESDGWAFMMKMRHFVTAMVADADAANVDLRDLASIMHGEIDLPISRIYLERRRNGT